MSAEVSTPKQPLGSLAVGLGLLIVAVITAAVFLVNVNSFSGPDSHGATVDVKAGKGYYLLSDEAALDPEGQVCELHDGENKDAQPKVSKAEPQFAVDSLKIQNVALPFTGAKGVFTKLTFSEDVRGAHYDCSKGEVFISSLSGTTLGALRWVTMLAGLSGLVVLTLAFAARRRASTLDSPDNETPAPKSGSSD